MDAIDTARRPADGSEDDLETAQLDKAAECAGYSARPNAEEPSEGELARGARRAQLPEGRLVPVELASEECVEYEFHCGMGMLRGKVVVR